MAPSCPCFSFIFLVPALSSSRGGVLQEGTTYLYRQRFFSNCSSLLQRGEGSGLRRRVRGRLIQLSKFPALLARWRRERSCSNRDARAKRERSWPGGRSRGNRGRGP